jgi:hypothetical protein
VVVVVAWVVLVAGADVVMVTWSVVVVESPPSDAQPDSTSVTAANTQSNRVICLMSR